MNHAVAVSTNNSKIVNVGLMSDCERGKWFRVKTFDKTLATVTVATSKQEFAHRLVSYDSRNLLRTIKRFPNALALI